MADYIPAYQVAPNYQRPELKAVPKTYRAERKAKKRKAERAFSLTRAQVRVIVMDRAKGCCERCGRKVGFDVAPYLDHHAQVNENPPRSLGGDPLDPAQCELLCRKCHFSGPSGAHAPTAERMTR
jgi:5-methylcytosine-specific restriction endonuclease McrA